MVVFEKVKKFIIAYIANNFKLSNKLTRVESNLNKKLQNLEKTLHKRITEQEKVLNERFIKSQKQLDLVLTKSVENEVLSLRNLIIPNGNKPIIKNHFLLFNYDKHFPKFGHLNLGDYIQTFAVKNALSTLFPNATYAFHDRDSFSSFGGGG